MRFDNKHYALATIVKNAEAMPVPEGIIRTPRRFLWDVAREHQVWAKMERRK